MNNIENFIEKNKSGKITTTIPFENINHSVKFTPYSIENAILVGITGSYGKSSAAYLVHKYLQFKGYRSTLISSISVDIPGSIFKKDIERNSFISSKRYLADLLDAAEKYEAEFIIMEINENIINNNILEDLNFNLKVLTAFKESANKHMDSGLYKKLKNDFICGETPVVLNSEADDIESFLSIATGEKFLFSFDDNFILTGVNSEKLSEKIKTNINLYPTFKLGSIDNSFFEYKLNGIDGKLTTTLSMNIGINMTILTMAILYKLNELDIESFSKFILNIANVPGRCEDVQWEERTIMFDSENDEFLEKVSREITSNNFAIAKQKYKEKYGVEYKTQTINNILAIFNLNGGASKGNLLKLRENKTFKFLNPCNSLDPETRKHFLIFGGNLLNMINQTNKFPKSTYKIDYFNGAVEELGSDKYFLDFSKDKTFSKTYLNNLYNDIVDFIMDLSNDHRRDVMLEFAWRSIAGLKAYFSIHLIDFEKIKKHFIELENSDLTAAVNFVSNIISKTNDAYKVHVEKINNINNIKKIYLTIDVPSFSNPDYEINKIKSLMTHDNIESFNDRIDALKKIIDESEKGDLILISGRGNKKLYFSNNGTSLNFTDKEFIERYCNLR